MTKITRHDTISNASCGKAQVYVISGRVAIKKNNRKQVVHPRTGKRFNLPSERYAIWAKMAMIQVLEQRGRRPTLQGPIHAHFKFYFENRQAEPDAENCMSGPMDVLEQARVFENDRQIQSWSGEKIFGGEPRTEVILRELAPSQPEMKAEEC